MLWKVLGYVGTAIGAGLVGAGITKAVLNRKNSNESEDETETQKRKSSKKSTTKLETGTATA